MHRFFSFTKPLRIDAINCEWSTYGCTERETYAEPSITQKNGKGQSNTFLFLCFDRLGGLGGSAKVLSDSFGDRGLFLGFQDGNDIGKRVARTLAASGVVVQHDLDLDTEDTLTKQDVTNSGDNKVTGRLTRVDHETVTELHSLGTGSTELARNNNLAALGTRFHNEADDTVAGTADSQTVKQLELDGFGLGDSAETAVLDTLGVKFDGVFGEAETLLNEGGEFTDTATLLAEDVLGVGGADDDSVAKYISINTALSPHLFSIHVLGACRSDTDFNASVTVFGQFTSKELVQFSIKDTVSNLLKTI